MSVGWVAGAIRSKALARRCMGAVATADLAAQKSLPEALRKISDSTYGHRVKVDMDLESAQRGVSETTLWHLRVLAGWLPPSGVDVPRALAAWFEWSDMAELAVAISGDRIRPTASYMLGPLATVSARASDAASLGGLRDVLAHSVWGDPGSDDLDDILLGLRLGWGRLLSRTFGEHPDWGAGELALSVAVALFLRPPGGHAVHPERVPQLGSRWVGAPSLEAFTARLPVHARWVLRGVGGPDSLWDAERGWWARLERDAEALLEGRALGRATVVGSAVTLLADCWRVRTALATAYRGGAASEELDGQG